MLKYLYDTHCHIDLFDSPSDIVNEIEQNQIYTIAVTNLPVLYTRLCNNLTNKYIRIALGFHPELLSSYKHLIPQMWTLLPSARYIGEVGLDFHVGRDKKLQISFFEKLIEQSNNLGNKILTIHSRKSAETVMSIVGNDFNGKIILHWFSGNIELLKRAINYGFFFSINYAMLNSKNCLEMIKNIPHDRLLLETDSPFVLLNGKPFKPKNIVTIIEQLSKLLDKDINQTSLLLWNNFRKLLL